MKLSNVKVLLLAALILCSFENSAQTPNGFKYQTIIRDNTGGIMQNHLVALKISILSGSASGTVQYSESHQITTTNFGLVNLNIGSGAILSGNLANLNWSTGTYFIKIEIERSENFIKDCKDRIKYILTIPKRLKHYPIMF